MAKTAKYIIIIILALLLHISTYSKDNRLKLANITIKYYNLLLNKNFDAINNMIDDSFSINGTINFKGRAKGLDFLKRVYAGSNKQVEIAQLSVFSYNDILKRRYRRRLIHLGINFNNIETGDWVALVSKMKVDGIVINTNSGLIFTKKNSQWFIKGMYIQ